jgi:hypothetical protein
MNLEKKPWMKAIYEPRTGTGATRSQKKDCGCSERAAWNTRHERAARLDAMMKTGEKQ